MPIITPIIRPNGGEVIDKSELEIGDIVQWIDPGKPDQPNFGIAIDPKHVDDNGRKGFGISILPIDVYDKKKFVENGERNLMLPQAFKSQRRAFNLDYRNGYMVRYEFKEVPLFLRFTGQEDGKILRVGEGAYDGSSTLDNILEWAFGRLGTHILLTPYTTPKELVPNPLRTQTNVFLRMGDTLLKEEVPERGERLFTEDFLRREKKPKKPRSKKAKINIARTAFESRKKADPETIEKLEAQPDNIDALLATNQLRERRLWAEIAQKLNIENISDIMALGPEETPTLNEILLGGNYAPATRLGFIRVLQSLDPEQYGFEANDILPFYGLIMHDNKAREFQSKHPKAHGHIYKMQVEGQTIEEIIEEIHKSLDNNLRSNALGAVLSASYLYHIEQFEIEKAPDLLASPSDPKQTGSISPAFKNVIYDINLEDAGLEEVYWIDIRVANIIGNPDKLISPEQQLKKGIINKSEPPVEIITTMRQLEKEIAINPDRLKAFKGLGGEKFFGQALADAQQGIQEFNEAVTDGTVRTEPYSKYVFRMETPAPT